MLRVVQACTSTPRTQMPRRAWEGRRAQVWCHAAPSPRPLTRPSVPPTGRVCRQPACAVLGGMVAPTACTGVEVAKRPASIAHTSQAQCQRAPNRHPDAPARPVSPLQMELRSPRCYHKPHFYTDAAAAASCAAWMPGREISVSDGCARLVFCPLESKTPRASFSPSGHRGLSSTSSVKSASAATCSPATPQSAHETCIRTQVRLPQAGSRHKRVRSKVPPRMRGRHRGGKRRAAERKRKHPPLRLHLPSRGEVSDVAGRVASTRPAGYPTRGVPPAPVRRNHLLARSGEASAACTWVRRDRERVPARARAAARGTPAR
jgi:hypothetical protein